MKKNFVIYLSVTDSPKFISGRRMLRVLEAME